MYTVVTQNCRNFSQSGFLCTANDRLIKVSNMERFTSVKRPPSPSPEALCFELSDESVDHVTVLCAIKKLTKLFKGTSVVTIHYIPRQKRWKINMDSLHSRNRLLGSTINVGGSCVHLQCFDAVVYTEYRKYLRSHGLLSMINRKK